MLTPVLQGYSTAEGGEEAFVVRGINVGITTFGSGMFPTQGLCVDERREKMSNMHSYRTQAHCA